jgi:thermitase
MALTAALIAFAAGGGSAWATGDAQTPSFDKPSVEAKGSYSGTPYEPPGSPGLKVTDKPPRPLDIAHDSRGLPYVDGEILVSYAPQASSADKSEVASDSDARVEDRFGEIDAQLLVAPEIEDEGPGTLSRTLDEIEADPAVESASPNYVSHTNATPNDELFPLEWGFSRIGTTSAWNRTVGANTVINDLDSGIPEGPGCDPNAGHEDIGGVIGQLDFVNGASFCPQDFNQHGTHTAGTAAALTNNNVGVAGTSPAGLLLIGKVCEDTGGGFGGGAACPIDAQIAGLLAAGNQPTTGPIPRPDVINMSLGGAGTTPEHGAAIKFARSRGIVIVVSAGNENESALKFPAAYPESIAVASTTVADTKSDFSNFGPWVDIAAPGGDDAAVSDFKDIISTAPFDFSSYQFLNGTSMSAPHVTGVASLIAATGRDASRIRYRLESGAKDIGPAGKDQFFGFGLLDANESTLPASLTKACKRATAAVNSAQATVDTAQNQVDKTKRKKKKAKRKLKQAKQNHDLNIKKAKKKLKKAKKKYKKAKAELAAANAALAAANQRKQTPCTA